MKKNHLKKGGIETIIGVIVLVGIVIALVIAVVIPLVNKTSTQGEATGGSQDKLGKWMSTNSDGLSEAGEVTGS